MIIAEIPKANYCSFFCFLLTMDECIINVWGYTEILPKADLALIRRPELEKDKNKEQIWPGAVRLKVIIVRAVIQS